MSSLRIGIFAFFGGVVLFAHDGMADGFSFSHKDWEMVCDNTRTCRAAGYQADGDERLVSILLTREAGPNTPVSMELQFRANEDESAPTEVRLTVGRLALANNIAVEKELPQEIAAKLLSAMPNEEEMTLTSGDKQGTLSLAGLKAMLLKMDDKQGRIGTPGALISKGTKPENQVLPPIPMKNFTVPIIPPTSKEDETILAALKKFLDAECIKNEAYPENSCKTERRIKRLSEDKLLVSLLVDRAAYNQTVAVYVINGKPPYNPKPAIEGVNVYNSAEEFEIEVLQNKGILHSSARVRGLGDCWSWASWAWTGKSFEKATEGSSGMCRGFGGGAWDLPTFVSNVVNKNENVE